MPTTKKTSTAKKAAPKKAAPKKGEVKEEVKKAAPKKKKEKKTGDYVYAVGRRKAAVAQTRIYPNGKGEITVNDRDFKAYFTIAEYQETVLAPLKACGQDDKVSVNLRITGGGPRGQADAARLGVSRALLEIDAAYRGTLKPLGFLTRDARVKERKKPGLKKARKAPQWAKR